MIKQCHLSLQNDECIDAIDLPGIDDRLNKQDQKIMKSTTYKNCTSLHGKLELFLSKLPHQPKIKNVTATDLRRFSVWCDSSGKTQIHSFECKFIGELGKKACKCRKGLSSNILAGMITNFKHVLMSGEKGNHRKRVLKRATQPVRYW